MRKSSECGVGGGVVLLLQEPQISRTGNPESSAHFHILPTHFGPLAIISLDQPTCRAYSILWNSGGRIRPCWRGEFTSCARWKGAWKLGNEVSPGFPAETGHASCGFALGNGDAYIKSNVCASRRHFPMSSLRSNLATASLAAAATGMRPSKWMVSWSPSSARILGSASLASSCSRL